MSSLLKSTRNTRALPTETMRYIRSDAPTNLTDEEIRWLLDNNITTIVDLRSDEEVLRKPCQLATEEGFQYYNLPVTGGGDIPKSNVMYFCTAGKDRTGVVSAMILHRLGFDDATIIEDYMKSKDNLMDMLTAYVEDHPEVDIEIIIPHIICHFGFKYILTFFYLFHIITHRTNSMCGGE